MTNSSLFCKTILHCRNRPCNCLVDVAWSHYTCIHNCVMSNRYYVFTVIRLDDNSSFFVVFGMSAMYRSNIIIRKHMCMRLWPVLEVNGSCTEAEVRRIIMASPTKSCSLDPVPTFLLREFIDRIAVCHQHGQRVHGAGPITSFPAPCHHNTKALKRVLLQRTWLITGLCLMSALLPSWLNEL